MGLGQIGQAIARAALEKPELRLCAAVDPAPAMAGKKLGDVLGAPAPDITIASDLRAALGSLPEGAVVLHATGSFFDKVAEQLETVVKAGFPLVSTCEELAFPW